MVAPVVGEARGGVDPGPVRERPNVLARCARHVELALARPRLLVALLVVYLPFFVVYFASPIGFSLAHAAAACHGQPVLDQRWGYSAVQVADYLHGAASPAALRSPHNRTAISPTPPCSAPS